ncbi:MAG: hypothetical protein EBU46_00425 [Nitrosomonadaceae bacterium]|nr:hypothetical protein [Nitrosomonadaceae bacterium]
MSKPEITVGEFDAADGVDYSKFFEIGLPKWPKMAVIGDPVTLEQAAEILIRTQRWSSIRCNDDQWNDAVAEISGYPVDNWRDAPQDSTERQAYFQSLWTKQQAWKDTHRILDSLNYLPNDQIASSYIGGPHGWCSWNGQIGCNDYNIGKWPSVESVFEEWKLIAAAFPFLTLRCQLFSEHENGNAGAPLVQYNVEAGAVTIQEPKKNMLVVELNAERMIDRLRSPVGERGCSIYQLQLGLKLAKQQ